MAETGAGAGDKGSSGKPAVVCLRFESVSVHYLALGYWFKVERNAGGIYTTFTDVKGGIFARGYHRTNADFEAWLNNMYDVSERVVK